MQSAKKFCREPRVTREHPPGERWRNVTIGPTSNNGEKKRMRSVSSLGYKAHRWVVERTHSWLNRFRKLLVSFEKTEEGYVALLALAAVMNCWRQTIVIYG
jgi:transposase